MSSSFLPALESMLFISGEPLSFSRLAKTLGTDEENIKNSLQLLSKKYADDEECGFLIITKDEKALLATKPGNASFVEALTKSSLQENLSKAALEVLAIIAYRSPIARSEIEAIRGVNCSFTLRNLLLRDLIERKDNPHDAREYVYYPTFRLLQSLGLESTESLPEYQTLSLDERLKMILPTTDQESKTEPKKETEN